MAKIEMDISEYEIMKENKTLLENSLKNERKLQQEIEKLREDKLRALEDAKYSVTKITKSESTEHVYLRRTFSDPTSDMYYQHRRHFALLEDSLRNGFGATSQNVENLIDFFFEKVTTHSIPVNETIVKGFDEVKEEIRQEMIKAQTKKDIEDLAQAKVTEKSNQDLKMKNRELGSSLVLITRRLNKNEKELEELESSALKMKSEHNFVHNKFKELSYSIAKQKKVGFFGARKALSEIIKKHDL